MDGFDIILTSNPNVIEKYDKTKKVIKYITSYNENIQSEISIEKLSDFESILDKLIK